MSRTSTVRPSRLPLARSRQPLPRGLAVTTIPLTAAGDAPRTIRATRAVPEAQDRALRIDRAATVGALMTEIASSETAAVVQLGGRWILPPLKRALAVRLQRGPAHRAPVVQLLLDRDVVSVIRQRGERMGPLRTGSRGLPGTYFQVPSERGHVPLFGAGGWAIHVSTETDVQRLVAALDAALLGAADEIAICVLADDARAELTPPLELALGRISARDPGIARWLRADSPRLTAVETGLEASFDQLRPIFERHRRRLEDRGSCVIDLEIDARGRVSSADVHRDSRGALISDLRLTREIATALTGVTLPVAGPLSVFAHFVSRTAVR